MSRHFQSRLGLDEASRFADVGSQRAFFEEQVVENVFEVIGLIQTDWLAALVLDADQRVVLQVLPDAGQIGDDGKAERAQMIRRA